MTDLHLLHRKAQEQDHKFTPDPFSSLVSVELNITELCNRKCVFCPRSDPEIYPNRKLHMSHEVADAVAADLAKHKSTARISVSGFGEPLLHPLFDSLIRTFRQYLPDNTIECNTNGDRVTEDRIRSLFMAGLSWLYINMYDGPEQEAHFKPMIGKHNVKLRPHWSEDFGLNLNNRSGTLEGQAAVKGRCNYPFYKMLVDWNGDVLFCSNDWGRKIIVGNVLEESLKDIWLSEKMKTIRLGLACGDRSRDPCNKCSVVGTLTGKRSFDLLMEHYGHG